MQAPPAKGGVAVVCSTLRHGLSGTQGYVSRSSRGFNEAFARRSDETPKMQLHTLRQCGNFRNSHRVLLDIFVGGESAKFP